MSPRSGLVIMDDVWIYEDNDHDDQQRQQQQRMALCSTCTTAAYQLLHYSALIPHQFLRKLMRNQRRIYFPGLPDHYCISSPFLKVYFVFWLFCFHRPAVTSGSRNIAVRPHRPAPNRIEPRTLLDGQRDIEPLQAPLVRTHGRSWSFDDAD